MLAHVRILLHALQDAVAGKPARLLALLPKQEDQEGVAPSLSTGDRLRAFAAAGVWGLWGATGITQKRASEFVSEEFKKAGISVEPDSAREFFKRVQKGHPGVHDLYKKLTADLPAARSLPERMAWLKQLAEIAGHILET